MGRRVVFKPPRVLVIGGAGDLGRNRILPALDHLGLQADVVDPQPGAASSTPASVVHSYPSLDSVPSGDGYLGIIVASPNHLHLRHCRWALGTARVPCLCEKPIAHTLDDARDMTLLAAAGPAPLWIADHYLAKPPSAFLLAQGVGLLSSVGALRHVHGRILEAPSTLTGREWLRNPERSGGGIWVDTGVHLVTMLLALSRAVAVAAAPPAPDFAALAELPWRILSATARGHEDDRGLAETYFCLSAAAGEAEITLEVGKTGDEPAKDLVLEGTGGTLHLDWQAGTVSRDGAVLFEGPIALFGGYLSLLESFAAACRERPEAPAAPAPGLVSCELAEQVLGFIKSAYACAGLPPGLRGACVR